MASRTPLSTHGAHGRLQDGVETALGGVQVARDPLSLQFPPELVHVVRQADDILEGEGGVTVGPRLLQPGQGREGERESGEQAPCSRVPTLCGKLPPGSVSAQRLARVWVEGRRAHSRDSCPRGHSLLRPHVCLRDADFVHELAKSDSIVAGELAQDLGWASTGKRGAAEPQHLHVVTGARRKGENDPLSTLRTLGVSPRPL